MRAEEAPVWKPARSPYYYICVLNAVLDSDDEELTASITKNLVDWNSPLVPPSLLRTADLIEKRLRVRERIRTAVDCTTGKKYNWEEQKDGIISNGVPPTISDAAVDTVTHQS
ncbi:hypothetical protein ACTXT7_009754 [Hymenolepis weldensis]